ncbi:heavy metal translocating P-type ATPase [Neobacillus drentensis]|uniref:heavy metal translocating P-type ATPase n=1 Tax=Neobacillus drentensis TaxID=220684 RepID=UPI0008267F59|nr:cation-translocating P-type ATPase [Neobacillus drentensis]
MMETINKHKNHITAISFGLLLIGFLASIMGSGEISDLALIIATILASIPIFVKAYQALRMKAFSIDLLVSIAVLGAVYLQDYTESSVVTFLFLFGDYLEARTLEKTRSSLKELVDMAPQEATVIRGGEAVIIPVEAVVAGDQVIVRSGGKVPVDGRILSGQAALNEAAITGESIPATKRADDRVFSSTMVDNGYIEIIAEKVGNDTTFAKIIELVEEAQESKTKTEKFLDKFSSIYTPAIVILSILVYVITRDLRLAITFLVIACPGALVIGAPVSSVAGIGNGAKNGVLVKGGEIIDTFSKVDMIIFDKTGTLTKGKPEVTAIKTFTKRSENELLGLVARAETISEHHLGQTIVKEALARRLHVPLNSAPVMGEVVKGSGILATINGHTLAVGNRRLMDSNHIPLSQEAAEYAEGQEKAGNTAIFAAVDGELEGIISIADQIREDAHAALKAMRNSGIKKMIMLTGDNRHTAELVARKLGLDDYFAELTPEDKANYVKKQKEAGHVVAMAGDGINDAPAIAVADIGLAMGEGGTDVAMETADIVLMADKLMQMSHAYSLSKATMRNMKQNTTLAVLTVVVLLIGVLIGSVHLAAGMFIHEASVLLVILNAMRLIRFNNRRTKESRKVPVIHPYEI